MAFRRQVEMEVGTSEGSVMISDLDIEFDISRSTKFENNTAKFKIYNPTSTTISKMLVKGNSVTFKAGYEDEGIGLIYIGQIVQSTPDLTGADHIVELECGSIQNANTTLEAVTVSLGYRPNTAISQVINEIANALGLGVYNLEVASGVKLANGYTLSGTAKEAMRYVQGVLNVNNLSMFIDNTTLTVFRIGEGDTKVKAVYLSIETGLMSAPKLTDNADETTGGTLTKRLVFNSILNYKIKPYGMLDVDYPTVEGTFVTEKCKFVGDNFGGNFNVSGEALAP